MNAGSLKGSLRDLQGTVKTMIFLNGDTLTTQSTPDSIGYKPDALYFAGRCRRSALPSPTQVPNDHSE